MASFYTTFEAARILGVSLPTVVNWIEARRLAASKPAHAGGVAVTYARACRNGRK